nr:biotin protein ligase [Hymenolepis microstoma]
MSSTSRSCWNCLKLDEFPFTSIKRIHYKGCSVNFVKKPNIFCRNVNKECLDLIQPVIDQTRYIVYPLSDTDWKNDVWQGSASLLILSESSFNVNHSEEILKIDDYICNEGGKVLLLLNKDCDHSRHEGNAFEMLKSSENLSQKFGYWTWKKIDGMLCLYGLMESPCFVVVWASSDWISSDNIKSVLEVMQISCYREGNPMPPTSEILLSLKPTDSTYTEWDSLAKLLTGEIKAKVDVVSSGNNGHSFSFSDYLSALGSSTTLGRNVFWAEVLPSSFTIGKSILQKLPKQSGLVLISATQTAGIGRGNNQWISPRGMACFTLHFDLPLLETEASCKLAQVLTWVQHLSSIAVTQTFNELLCQYDNGTELDVEMKIKWPNDVYAIDKKTNTASKVAGAVSTASLSDTTKAKCLLGIGINVANPVPTTCLLEIIQRCSAKKDVEMPSVATVIGRTIFHFEKLIGQLERGDKEGIKELYTKFWMHSGQRIKAMCKDERIECVILGVDDFGYLIAKQVENGELVTLHTDGNSIDMVSRTVITRSF